MGTDVYHGLSDDADPADKTLQNAIADAYDRARAALNDDAHDPCDAYNCSGDCRRNDEETNRAILALSRELPTITFRLSTTWFCDDNPEEITYFKAGRVQVAAVHKIAAKADESIMREPEACECGAMFECRYTCDAQRARSYGPLPWRKKAELHLTIPEPFESV